MTFVEILGLYLLGVLAGTALVWHKRPMTKRDASNASALIAVWPVSLIVLVCAFAWGLLAWPFQLLTKLLQE